MRMKPILFNTEMVQAILEGRKTQTRRIVKGLEYLNVYRAVPADDAYETLEKWDFFHGWSKNGAMIDAVKEIKAPCSVGDVLWVRETWKQATHDYAGGGYAITDGYIYKADEPLDTRGMLVEERWHPSIHMPRSAARIFLRVKNVRVERLHDMDEEAAIAEGFKDSPAGTASPLERFTTLWDKTVKREDLRRYGYHADPWVWVIEFERCEKPLV